MIDTRALEQKVAAPVSGGRRIRLAIVAGVIVLGSAAGIGTWQATAHGSSTTHGSSAVVKTTQQLSSFEQLKSEGHPDPASAQRLASFEQLKNRN